MARGGRIPSNQQWRFGRPRSARGFTLFELLLTGAVCALLLAIAAPSYRSIVERQKVGQCVRDLLMIAEKIEKYRTMHGFKPPMSLGELGAPVQKDPWGFDYRYLNFAAAAPGVMGQIRKDHNLHPLNSEFDLYSVGPDGDSRAPLTAKASGDDVIWARDGAFVGIARDY
ncbi:MAG: prepilin-type cleavage/methylation domain-containing protein [Lysobacterales bacterium]|nr:MAG: prepilin-type cleavage/methylation domain-containing protein [Xanthomonadales bacterium]